MSKLVQKIASRLDLPSIESDRNVIRTQQQAVSKIHNLLV